MRKAFKHRSKNKGQHMRVSIVTKHDFKNRNNDDSLKRDAQQAVEKPSIQLQ
jgi:hypothetical protein